MIVAFRAAFLVASGLALGLAVGCATTTATVSPEKPVNPFGRRPPPTARTDFSVEAPVFGDEAWAFFDGHTGTQLPFAAVVARLKASRVVVVGEQHDQRTHHELQRRIVEVMCADGPGVVVGLEMLTWEKQPQLDAFNRGDVDAEGLRDSVDWKKAWGFDFGLYSPIFDVGHKGGARFVALNAPRDLVRALRQKGVDGLEPKQRQSLPELDFGDDLHRSWFKRIFSGAGHPLKPAELDGFYRAQVLWDEAMADRTARASLDGARQVVVIAGAGHVANGRGIPQRVERRIGAPVLSVVPLSGVDSSNAAEAIAKAVVAAEGEILAVPRFEPEINL